MRTKIEAVLNNKDAKAQDYFELVNIYEYSQVTLVIHMLYVNGLLIGTIGWMKKGVFPIHISIEQHRSQEILKRMELVLFHLMQYIASIG